VAHHGVGGDEQRAVDGDVHQARLGHLQHLEGGSRFLRVLGGG
jgi:hypothetical protein